MVHLWQADERDALEILYREYDLNNGRLIEAQRIFNHIFISARPTRSPWQAPPAVDRLRDEWRGRFLTGRSQKWTNIHSKALNAYNAAERVGRAEIRVEILQAANFLNIGLTPTPQTAALHAAAVTTIAALPAPNGAPVLASAAAVVNPTAALLAHPQTAQPTTTAIVPNAAPNFNHLMQALQHQPVAPSTYQPNANTMAPLTFPNPVPAPSAFAQHPSIQAHSPRRTQMNAEAVSRASVVRSGLRNTSANTRSWSSRPTIGTVYPTHANSTFVTAGADPSPSQNAPATLPAGPRPPRPSQTPAPTQQQADTTLRQGAPTGGRHLIDHEPFITDPVTGQQMRLYGTGTSTPGGTLRIRPHYIPVDQVTDDTVPAAPYPNNYPAVRPQGNRATTEAREAQRTRQADDDVSDPNDTIVVAPKKTKRSAVDGTEDTSKASVNTPRKLKRPHKDALFQGREGQRYQQVNVDANIEEDVFLDNAVPAAGNEQDAAALALQPNFQGAGGFLLPSHHQTRVDEFGVSQYVSNRNDHARENLPEHSSAQGTHERPPQPGHFYQYEEEVPGGLRGGDADERSEEAAGGDMDPVMQELGGRTARQQLLLANIEATGEEGMEVEDMEGLISGFFDLDDNGDLVRVG